jgi:hypothetical protein
VTENEARPAADVVPTRRTPPPGRAKTPALSSAPVRELGEPVGAERRVGAAVRVPPLDAAGDGDEHVPVGRE